MSLAPATRLGAYEFLLERDAATIGKEISEFESA